MKLWLLSQDENNGWDTYDSMVVSAENEEAARNILPPYETQWGRNYCVWASSPEHVTVEYIGEAKEGTQTGVILASFNAG